MKTAYDIIKFSHYIIYINNNNNIKITTNVFQSWSYVKNSWKSTE